MTGKQGRHDVDKSRQLLTRLRELGAAPPPPSLAPAILLSLGLADAYARVPTSIGDLLVAYNNHGISAVMRAGDELGFEGKFRRRYDRAVRRVDSLPASLAAALTAYLAGQTASPPPCDLRGLSEFEQAVLLKATEVPRGEVRPYAWIAKEIGRPKAVRAVGTALAHNPVPVVIPCHRVVRSDGSLGNYVFGSDLKRHLLDVEGAAPEVLDQLTEEHVRYFGYLHSRNYCLPTCGGDHRQRDPSRIALRSAHEALVAGFQPCSQCRPAGLK